LDMGARAFTPSIWALECMLDTWPPRWGREAA
jgi:hypothetical protein